ncbi:MAG: NADH-quinone oxidoreductase subunit M [Nitrososphaeria archaeon]|nr:NADH-quinone oxidoreductase subunit M [Nitrososphaeria archaeon]
MIAFSLLQIIVVPIFMAIIIMLFGKMLEKKCGWLSFASLFYILCILLTEILNLSKGGYSLLESYSFTPLIGDFTLLLDGISGVVALTITLLSLVISLYSIKYMEHEENFDLYNVLYLLYYSGMVGTVLSTNLVIFFLFFELMLIPSWILIGIWGTGEREKVALKYFLFTEAGAVIMLAGIGSTYMISGSFDLFVVAERTLFMPKTILYPIVVLILIGLLVKMAIFPLHNWLPDAHAEAPTPISALLSPAMIGIGGYAAIRILYTSFPTVAFDNSFTFVLTLLSVITMAYGGIMAFSQDDIKRLLAFSSISQMGYMLFGIASASIIGLTGSLIIYVSHGLSKAALFMISGVFMHNLKTRKISDLGGLASKMPLTAISTLVSFLGLAGVPPLLGFWGEFFIFAGAVYGSFNPIDYLKLVTVIVGILVSILTAGYGLWTVRRIFYGELNEKYKGAKDPEWEMLVPILIMILLAIVVGVYPAPLTSIVSNIIKNLF